jgi:hypothetical protein
MSLLVHQCVPEKGIYGKLDITSMVTGRGVQIAFANESLELCDIELDAHRAHPPATALSGCRGAGSETTGNRRRRE